MNIAKWKSKAFEMYFRSCSFARILVHQDFYLNLIQLFHERLTVSADDGQTARSIGSS